MVFFIILFVLNYGLRHFKLFTKCCVSWDTLYLRFTTSGIKDIGIRKLEFVDIIPFDFTRT